MFLYSIAGNYLKFKNIKLIFVNKKIRNLSVTLKTNKVNLMFYFGLLLDFSNMCYKNIIYD